MRRIHQFSQMKCITVIAEKTAMGIAARAPRNRRAIAPARPSFFLEAKNIRLIRSSLSTPNYLEPL
jgi:hypothetical protein